MRILLLLTFILIGSSHVWAAEDTTKTAPITANFSPLKSELQPITIRKFIDPLTFIGMDDVIYKLSGLDVPGLDSGGSEISTLALQQLNKDFSGKEYTAYVTKNPDRGRVNRMGQKLLHLVGKKDQQWVQGLLVSQGLARVRSTPANPELTRELLKLEDAARQAKRGLWSNPEYAVLNADQVDLKNPQFRIIEGRVFNTATKNNEIFINFGSDWRKDFTIGVPIEARKNLSKAGLDAMRLAHKKVRVRGYIEDRNGPFITLDHPEQIEILDGPDVPLITSQSSGGSISAAAPAPSAPQEPEKPEIESPAAPTIEKPKARGDAND